MYLPGITSARHLVPVFVLTLTLPGRGATAGYLDNIDYTRLAVELGAMLPDAAGVPVMQVEAAVGTVDHDDNPSTPELPVYLPDPATGDFAGKVITDRSGLASGSYSGHASAVGRRFYGNTLSVAPGITAIDAYHADGWLLGDYLDAGGNLVPQDEPARVVNHSWVGQSQSSAFDAEVLRRLDWTVDRDEVIHAVGTTNSPGNSQNLLSGAYNDLTAGLASATHGTGTNTIDADYGAGRQSPQLVVPIDSSSVATPAVAATAALLIGKVHASPGLSSDPVEISTTLRNGATVYNAERAEVIRAALMAGADRHVFNPGDADITDYRSAPAEQTANGLDRRYGAGQLNVYNSYHILAAGEQNSSEDLPSAAGQVAMRGFDYDPLFGGGGNSNATASYYFSSGANPAIITVALVWNIDIAVNGNVFGGAATLHDLDLRLYDVSTGQQLLASSASTLDNTENIHLTLLPAHDYLLQVSANGTFSHDYALAWQVLDDSDADQVPDGVDQFPLDPSEHTDTDNDGSGDNADDDDDGDGFDDVVEIALGHDPLDAGDAPQWGDLDHDDQVDMVDVVIAQQAALGRLVLDDVQQATGRVAPLVNGEPAPQQGIPFGTADFLLILRKVQGQVDF